MPDGECSACGAPVRWVITVQGRRVEIDLDPHPDGNVVRVDVDGQVRARVLTGDELPALDTAWRRHRQTCTESPEAKARRARAAPRCRSCGGPMDPTLTALEGWREHPACDSTAAAELVRHAANPAHREAS